MVPECCAKRQWGSLFEKDTHLDGRVCAPGGVFKHGANLVFSDSWKPLDELRNRGSVFQVLEERRHRYAGSAKHPGATESFRITLNGRAG